MTGRGPRRDPSSVEEIRPRFVRVLAIDATGVTTLSLLALLAGMRDRRSRNSRGLAGVAAVGAAGVVLAVLAVRRVDRRGVAPHPDAVAIGSARRLITCGLVVNTIGTIAVAWRYRDSSVSLAAALIMLLGGNVLSVRYLRHLAA